MNRRSTNKTTRKTTRKPSGNGHGNGRKTNQEVYQMISDRMVEALEKGVTPWRKPWTTKRGGAPRSMSTGKLYRGINVWVLGLTAMTEGYASPYWGTFDRIAEESGMVKVPRPNGHGYYWKSPDGTPRGVRKGEHHTDAIWWKRVTKCDPDDPDGEPRTFYMAGTEYVFNASQADWPEGHKFQPGNIDPDIEVDEIPDAEELAQRYLDNGGPSLREVYQDRAYYQSGPDMITLPDRSQYHSSGELYSTMFHELGHSTGHPKRLNREGIAEFDHFGSGKYGREELVAEMVSAYLAAMAGIDTTFDNSAAYLGSWIKTIKGDITLVAKAATEAQKAVDLILGEVHEDEHDHHEVTPEQSPAMAV